MKTEGELRYLAILQDLDRDSVNFFVVKATRELLTAEGTTLLVEAEPAWELRPTDRDLISADGNLTLLPGEEKTLYYSFEEEGAMWCSNIVLHVAGPVHELDVLSLHYDEEEAVDPTLVRRTLGGCSYEVMHYGPAHYRVQREVRLVLHNRGEEPVKICGLVCTSTLEELWSFAHAMRASDVTWPIAPTRLSPGEALWVRPAQRVGEHFRATRAPEPEEAIHGRLVKHIVVWTDPPEAFDSINVSPPRVDEKDLPSAISLTGRVDGVPDHDNCACEMCEVRRRMYTLDVPVLLTRDNQIWVQLANEYPEEVTIYGFFLVDDLTSRRLSPSSATFEVIRRAGTF